VAFGVALLVAAGVLLAADTWIEMVGRGLVCDGYIENSDAIVIENLDSDYLLFERAAQLVREGRATPVLVPVWEGREPGRPRAVEEGIVQVMARIARLTPIDLVPVREQEPITLNVARQVREHLQRAQVRSVIVIAQGFRSRRSLLVWQKALQPVGIHVFCVPVFGSRSPENWRNTWHGWQVVALQFLKLQYYRWFIL
jgi:hypothetical protein